MMDPVDERSNGKDKNEPKKIKSFKDLIVLINQSAKESNAFPIFLNNFVRFYSIRTGLSLAFRMIKILRGSKKLKVFKLSELLSEQKLVVREDAVRLALFLGSFTGGYSFLKVFLEKLRGKVDSWNYVLAGGIAGLSILSQEGETRKNLSLYLFARCAQCLYNSAKAKGWWHFWGSDWNHGDSLLFAICSAQVMYAYVMRSTTFLSCFVQWYMSIICLFHNILPKDHRFLYFVTGFFSSLAILVEKKSRRSELALYALPRSLDSVYAILYDRNFIPFSIPFGDVFLFSSSMAGAMYFYEKESQTMAPFLKSILDRVLEKKK